jgi:hypothetical protein
MTGVEEMLQELEHDYEDLAIADEADIFGVTKYLTLTSDLSNLDEVNAQPVP